MKIEQTTRVDGEWITSASRGTVTKAQLALVFGSPTALGEATLWSELAARYAGARIVGCSTAGEIAGTTVSDDTVVVTAVELEHGHIAIGTVRLDPALDSSALGKRLAVQLPTEGLVHVLVISEGLKVNGSGLVSGLVSVLPAKVRVTGGLSGDAARFGRTTVCVDGPTPTDQIVAIGFYGERLQVSYGSRGGWDRFGPERAITSSSGNVLRELDGEPALDLYKRYLGDHASGLPASGLLFPLEIWSEGSEPVVRTILAVDEVAKTMTFAGDLPVGYRARLMKANFERLIGGASTAATESLGGETGPDLAILISCVGRKLVLGQRIEEEVEAVREVFGEDTVMTGFYSYGEVSPFSRASPCELHNQTMTVTTISER